MTETKEVNDNYLDAYKKKNDHCVFFTYNDVVSGVQDRTLLWKVHTEITVLELIIKIKI